MKKTKTYKYLHTDLFFLFFVGFLFFGAAAITQMYDAAATSVETKINWQYRVIRGSWIGSGGVVGLICSYFFFIKVMNRDEDMISQVAIDSASDLHSEGEEINETEGLEVAGESVDGDAEPTEEIFVSPELNI
ncbi:hypothetical protein WEN_03315 [Mycoplasma wenyonii str. Massachusetts]|uniref:Uncharacterized protein n=2 Tax=Mycoplasma wenyonii TaxID=65123 RepID=I6ZJQ6_MYCWM|nr:hypothetical protein WEN_03315 [Mycoplasma wenyonii str. Massachusetts]